MKSSKEDSKDRKCFITFPIPYQNGTLHLGHGYTLSKADFFARFKQKQEVNVLFPFGFHLTGTPITACANKLKESLQKYDLKTVDIDGLEKSDQIRILYNMGIPKEEIPKFVDPYYWGIYFPEKAKEDLKLFDLSADFTRSFITTDVNPHFDSFVKWQFNQLHKKGYLFHGKKPIIYSPKDEQACGAHDRSVGENVKLKEFDVIRPPLSYVLTDNISGDNIKCIIVHPEDHFKEVHIGNSIMIARDEFFRNYQYQIEEPIKQVKEFDGKSLIGKQAIIDGIVFSIQESKVSIPGSGFRVIPKNKEDARKSTHPVEFKYYEPADTVISRSGDRCVVSITDQWFIDYSQKDLKEKVNEYIKNEINTFSEEVKNKLMAGSNWIEMWPCSRSFGLGTKLLDTEYLIDTLSDSTIYMAYYTVCHLINQIPVNLLNDDLWNYILMNEKLSPVHEPYQVVMDEMRSQFKYWYPVDLRVSGKDLVENHLTMALYNHMMIWDKEMLPRNYYANGYLTINKEKMSKSAGVFMTLRDAIDQFGADATRYTLATAGSGMEDANFSVQNAKIAINRLDNEKKWIIDIVDQIIANPLVLNSFWDDIFENEIKELFNYITKCYERVDFLEMISNGVNRMLQARDDYRVKYETGIIPFNPKVMKFFIDHLLIALYPICPNYVQGIWSHIKNAGIQMMEIWACEYEINKKLSFHQNIIQNVIGECRKIAEAHFKKNGAFPSLTIQCFESYTNKEKELIDLIKNEYQNKPWGSIIGEVFSKYPTEKKELGGFMGHVKSYLEQYGDIWYTHTQNSGELISFIEHWVPKLLTQFSVNIIRRNDKINYKHSPEVPLVNKNLI